MLWIITESKFKNISLPLLWYGHSPWRVSNSALRILTQILIKNTKCSVFTHRSISCMSSLICLCPWPRVSHKPFIYLQPYHSHICLRFTNPSLFCILTGVFPPASTRTGIAWNRLQSGEMPFIVNHQPSSICHDSRPSNHAPSVDTK